MWFLFRKVFFSSWCLRCAALFYCDTHCAFHMIISSPEPLGSQSELIVYPSSRRLPSVGVVRRRQHHPSSFTMLKDLLFRTALPIKARFYVEPPWVGGTIFCSRHLGHITKMAATLIYGKNHSKIFFSRIGGQIITKLGTWHRGL